MVRVTQDGKDVDIEDVSLPKEIIEIIASICCCHHCKKALECVVCMINTAHSLYIERSVNKMECRMI